MRDAPDNYLAVLRACADANGVVVGSIARCKPKISDIDVIVPRSSMIAVASAIKRSGLSAKTQVRQLVPDKHVGKIPVVHDGGPYTQFLRHKMSRTWIVCDGLPEIDVWMRDDGCHAAHLRHCETRKIMGVPMLVFRPSDEAHEHVARNSANQIDAKVAIGKIQDEARKSSLRLIVRKRTRRQRTARVFGCRVCWLPSGSKISIRCGSKALLHRWLHLNWLGYPWPLRLRITRSWWPLYVKSMPGCGCIAPLKRMQQRLVNWWKNRRSPAASHG